MMCSFALHCQANIPATTYVISDNINANIKYGDIRSELHISLQ